MAISKQYLNQAIEMLSGNKQSEITQNQNAYNTNLQSLEGQKAGVNQNFDRQLEQNSINTTMNKNQYLNNSLARGIGRSTIATSGAAGIQDSGNRRANYVEQDRVNALNNIEAQKSILQQNLQATLLGIETDYNSQAMKLAMDLEDRAWSRSQSSRGSSGGGSSSSSKNTESAWGTFDTMMNNYINQGGFSPRTWAEQQYRAGAIDEETYRAMVSIGQEAESKKINRNNKAQSDRNASWNEKYRQTK